MSRFLLTGTLLVATLFLTACDETTIQNFYVGDGELDKELQSLLRTHDVKPIPEPAAEDPDLVELGRMLFYDKELSGNRNISCATCHHPSAFTGDGLPVSIGEGGSGLAENRSLGTGVLIPRNAPHVFNLGTKGFDVMFWDGRVSRDPLNGHLMTPEPKLNGPTPALPAYTAQLTSALAAQAMFPVTSHDEMRGQPGSGNDIEMAADNEAVWNALMARLVGVSNGNVGGIAEYRTLFSAAYPGVADYDAFNFAHAARAMAAFERNQWTTLDSPFDRYLRGDRTALSDSEKRGAIIFFGKGNCGLCHSGPHLTDFQFASIGAPQVGPGKEGSPRPDDRGLGLRTMDPANNYKFRVPPLRNVAVTGPWLHDGAYMTLRGVVEHHLDPSNSLLTYDASQLPPLYQPTVDTDTMRNADRIKSIHPILRGGTPPTEDEIDDLMDFLHALTDPKTLNLGTDVPDAVPSGLPVQD